MSDPRVRIEAGPLGCQRMPWTPAGEREWVIGQRSGGHSGLADWPEVVAFAQAILAADAEWREEHKAHGEVWCRLGNHWHVPSVQKRGCWCAEHLRSYNREYMKARRAKLAEGGSDG